MTRVDLLHLDPLAIAAPYWAIGLLSFPRTERAQVVRATLPEAAEQVRSAFDELRRHRRDDLLCLAARTVIDACVPAADGHDTSSRVFGALSCALPPWRARLSGTPLRAVLPWPVRWHNPTRGDDLVALADAWVTSSFPHPVAG